MVPLYDCGICDWGGVPTFIRGRVLRPKGPVVINPHDGHVEQRPAQIEAHAPSNVCPRCNAVLTPREEDHDGAA